jgi:prolyl 4-hydroxylase
MMTMMKKRMNVAFQLASVLCLALFLLVQCCEANSEVLEHLDGVHGVSEQEQEPEQPELYGTDVSWPMHYHIAIMGEPATGTIAYRQQELYREFMTGCFENYGGQQCMSDERERIARNLAVPAQQTNFTSAGYAKVRAPEKAFEQLSQFWKARKEEQRVEEKWSGNTYANHWVSPTEMLSIDEQPVIKRMVTEQVQEILEAWSGQTLIPTSVYGIRAYHNQSILAPHVDRLPLVISAIINVDQDVDEPWPLEVIGHDGVAVNVTMEPGDMVLYESHSVIHGRPYPLSGKYFANLFLHFEPFSYTVNQEQRNMAQNDSGEKKKTAKELFEQAAAKQETYTNKESQGDLPHYIEAGTQQAMQWLQDYVFYRLEPKKKKAFRRTSGVKEAHMVAASGDLEELKTVAVEDPESLHASDSNGWKPIHEAARMGRTNIIEYLIEEGADVNERTNEGKGGSPLWWAEHMLPPGTYMYCHGTCRRCAPVLFPFFVSHIICLFCVCFPDHPTIQFLRGRGAVAFGPHE